MKKFILKNDRTKLSFEADSGIYSVQSGAFVLKHCSPSLSLNGKACSFGGWTVCGQTADALRVEAVGDSGTWRLDFTLDRQGALTISLSGTLRRSCREIDAACFDGAAMAADHLLVLGRAMGGCAAIPLKAGVRESFTGYLQCLATKDGEQLQFSYPLQCRFLPCFSGNARAGKIAGFKAGARIRHYTPRRIALEPLTLRRGDGITLMRNYGEENSRGQKDFADMAVPGWNSWDYYRWTVTEDEVLENAEFIAADPVLSRHVKRIIVDDGWQYAYGEWEANSLFPHGMKALAKRIADLGFDPGLWVAPVLIEPHSRIAQTQYDMLAGNEAGHPAIMFECMRRYGFLLDPTVEKSRRFLRDTFDRLASDGYRYFKLDFLSSILEARRFADRRTPRGKLMELIVGTIRDAVAGRARILGCNYLYCGGPALADAVRIGADIHAKWEAIQINTPAIAGMFWANRKLWVNDPDFALCRSFDTCVDPDMNRLRACMVFNQPDSTAKQPFGCTYHLVDNRRPQAELLLSLAIAAGGALNLSDRMTKLNEAGLDLARRTVSAEPGEAAVPLDLFSEKLPKFWVQKVGDHHRVLLVNWSDEETELELDLAANGIAGRHAVNFWNDAPVTAANGRIKAALVPRSGLFVVLR